jgi:uncharacterized protein YecE (DUF72 family)
VTRADPLAAPPPLESLRGAPQPARVGNLLIGTASWTDRTLLESRAFYPTAVKTAADRLRYYARHFPVVEVDATYYALPSARNAAAWADRTPADFVFGVKAFAAMTGHPMEPKRLDPDLRRELPEKLRRATRVRAVDVPPAFLDLVWQRFVEALAPLRAVGKVGYVLVQMPPWFRPGREASEYLERLPERLRGLPIAFELRAADWFANDRTPHTLSRLRALGLSYVSVDAPQGTPASVPPVAVATHDDFAVVRFHGRRVETWTRAGVGTHERFRYRYTDRELAEWVPRLRTLARTTHRVFVLMNNCHRESAVQGAKDLARLLAGAAPGG